MNTRHLLALCVLWPCSAAPLPTAAASAIPTVDLSADRHQQVGLARPRWSVDVEDTLACIITGEAAGELEGGSVAAADDEIFESIAGDDREIEDKLHGQKRVPWGEPVGTRSKYR